MRDRALRGLIAAALGVAATAAAQEATVTLEPPERLVEGDTATVVAIVTVGPDVPVMLTPASEGTAVEVVRGRLLREDADDPTAATLRFRVPVVARGPGTAVLRVRVRSFSCPDRSCEPTSAESSVVVRVLRRAE